MKGKISPFKILLLKCLKFTPTNTIYWILFIILKLIGSLIITHDFTKADKSTLTYVVKIFRYFTFFGQLDTPTFSKIDYNILCFIIYFFFLLPIILFSLLWIKYKKCDMKGVDEDENLTLFDKIILRFIAAITHAIMLFSQHIFEILAFAFTNSWALLNMNTNAYLKLDIIGRFVIFDSSLIFNNYAYSTINAIIIILMNILIYYYVLVINSPLFNSHSPIKFHLSKTFLLSLIILFNLQSVHYYSLMLISESSLRFNLSLGFLILTIVTCFFHLLSYSNYIFSTMMNYFIIFLVFLSLYTGIFYLIIYFTFSSIDIGNNFSISLIIMTEILGIALCCLICYLFVLLINKSYLSQYIENIFSKNKKIRVNSLYALAALLKECVFDHSKFTHFFELINEHLVGCNEDDCVCNIFDIENYKHDLRSIKDFNPITKDYRMKKFRSLFNNFIILVENEIVNNIYIIETTASFENYMELLLLHVDFALYFRSTSDYGIFILNGYSRIKNMNFFYKFYFLKLQKRVIKFYKHSEKLKNEKVKFLKIFNHATEIKYIETLILKIILNYEDLMKFKNEYNSLEVTLQKDMFNVGKKLHMDELLEICRILEKNNHKLIDFLKSNYSKKIMRNPEMSFILYNFFQVVNKEIPFELENCFLKIDSYTHLSNYNSSYESFEMKHPMIINLHNNHFKIVYLSQKLCDILGYRKSELLNEDLHCLMPKTFSSEHGVLMKKFILIDDNNYLKKETFILTKGNYYFPVTIELFLIPTYFHNTIIIDFRHEIKNNDRDCIVLDRSLNLISFNKEYEYKYKLTFKMFEKMRISFLNLYGINEDTVTTNFRLQIDEINNNSDYDQLERMTNLYNEVKLIITMKIINRIKSFEKDKRVQTIIKSKRALLPYLMKLETLIKESEYGIKWLDKIHKMQKYCYNRSESNMIKFKDLKQQNSLSDYPLNSFVLSINLKNLGSVPFFFIELLDTELINKITKNNINEIDSDSCSDENKDIVPDNKTKNTKNKKQEINKIISVSELMHNNGKKMKINNNIDNHRDRLFSFNGMGKDLKQTEPVNTNTNNNYTKLSLNNTIHMDSSINQLMHVHKKYGSQTQNLNTIGMSFEINEKKKYKKDTNKFKFRIFKVFNQKRNKKEILFLTLFLFILITQVAQSIYNIFYTISILNSSLNVFYINYYLMVLKSTIYSTSSVVISSCFKMAGLDLNKVDGFSSTMADYQSKLSFRSTELLKFTYNLNYYLALNSELDGIDQLNEILYKVEEYSLLSQNWKIYTRNSTLVDELKYYHYYISYLQNLGNWGNNTCKINIFGRSSTTDDVIANFGETTTHYVIFNAFTKMRIKIEALVVLSEQLQKNFHLNSKNSLFLYNIFSLLLYICLSIAILILLLIYQKIIVDSLKILLKQRLHDLRFEKELANLKSIVNCLDKIKGESFEFKKQTILLDHNLLLKKETDKKNESIKNKNKLDIEMIPEEMKTDEIHLKINFRIHLISTSIILLAISAIVYIILICVNVAINSREFDDLVFANQVTMSFLERISRYVSLILYYKISMLIGNPNFTTTPQSNYTLDNPLADLFGVSINIEDNSIYKVLKESDFASIYYKFQIHRLNINAFMEGPYNSILPSIRLLETQINSQQICMLLVNKFIFYYNQSPLAIHTFIGNYLKISSLVMECRLVAQGVNQKGVNTALDTQSAIVLNLYLDYIQSSNKKKKLFLLDINFIRAAQNTDYTLKLILNTDMYYSLIDMNDIYNKTIFNEYIFSCLKMISVFGFILNFLFLMLFKLQNYCFFLDITIKKFKKAIS